MKNLKALASKHPVIFSGLIMLLAILFTEIPLKSLFLPWLEPQYAQYLSGIILQYSASLILLFLLVPLGLIKKAGFQAPRPWKDLWLVWPLIAVTLINFMPLLDGSLLIDTSKPGLIVLFSLLVLSTGFFEEILVRNVILLVLLEKWGSTRRGVYGAVLVSSLIFGGAHLVNLVENRFSLVANLSQIVYAFFFAVLFAACFLRLKSIWPGIILHAVFDFAGMLSQIAVGGGLSEAAYTITVQQALINTLVTLPLLLQGLFILRNIRPTIGTAAPHPLPLLVNTRP